MPIGKLDHYSIRTLDIEASRRFYTEMAFAATGLAEMRQRLQRLNIAHRERTVPSLGLHQVFFEDPSQVTIELNYPAAEAAAG